MEDGIQVISDGAGIAIIGEPEAVERRLRSEGLWESSRRLDLGPLKRLVGLGADAARAASDINASSGRWLKLTEESARLVKEHGLMESKTAGESHVMVGAPGAIRSWLQAETSAGTMLSNPAVLSGVAGLMAQVAAKQAMAELTDYLITIDAKVDAVLRKVDDAAVANIFGLQAAIDRAMTMLDTTGEVDEITWSTVDQAHVTIGATQKYALDQLDAIAASLEGSKVGQLAHAADEAAAEVHKWLGVLALCLQLHEAVDVLELDRRIGQTPAKLDAYRQGMWQNRQNRRLAVVAHTGALLARMDRAAGTANAKLVWTRSKSLVVIESGNHVAADVGSFHRVLEIESEAQSWEPAQLGWLADIGSKTVQKAKDGAPVAGTMAGFALAGVVAYNKLRGEKPS